MVPLQSASVWVPARVLQGFNAIAALFFARFLQLQLLAFGKTLASQALEPLPPSCKRVGAKRGAR